VAAKTDAIRPDLHRFEVEPGVEMVGFARRPRNADVTPERGGRPFDAHGCVQCEARCACAWRTRKITEDVMTLLHGHRERSRIEPSHKAFEV